MEFTLLTCHGNDKTTQHYAGLLNTDIKDQIRRALIDKRLVVLGDQIKSDKKTERSCVREFFAAIYYWKCGWLFNLD